MTAERLPRSRRQAWLRDELVLALDLYKREGRNPARDSVERLSAVLRSLPIEGHLAENENFRNANSVYLKISNFVAIDPEAETAGMARGGLGDQAAWDELGHDPLRLRAAAAAIEANAVGTPAQEAERVDDMADAPEGRLLTRVHVTRERSRRLVEARKAQAIEAGSLACEACGFDFEDMYGERGREFIECHHVLPVSQLKPSNRTKVGDLVLLCANCHRMIHRRAPWLTVSELRACLRGSR